MKKFLAALVAILFLTCTSVEAQYPYYLSDPPRTLFSSATGMVFVPNVTTSLASKTVYLDYVSLSNVTGGAVTVTIADKSTNCNSGVCTWLASVSIAANTTYIIRDAGGHPFVGGITWAASASNSIVGYLRGSIGQV